MSPPKDPLKFPWPEYVRWRRPWWAYINPWRYAWTMERSYALMAEALESEVKWEIAGRPTAAIVRAPSPPPRRQRRGAGMSETAKQYWDWHATADTEPEEMHGWIQWKGTNVCMDIRCACGELHHVDADFAYNLVLPCGRVVMVGQHVRLVEVPEHLKAMVAAGDDVCVRRAE